jgi:hypothetical protein
MSNGPDKLDETLWRHDIKMGWLRKKVVYSYLITNKRIVSGSQVLNIMLCDDEPDLLELFGLALKIKCNVILVTRISIKN